MSCNLIYLFGRLLISLHLICAKANFFGLQYLRFNDGGYMQHLAYWLVYNLIVFPAMFVAIHFGALFSTKIRRGVVGRYRTYRRLHAFLKNFPNAERDVFLFHCASMGEFEHIKPLLRKLKKLRPDSQSVVMFFSPSGYENVKTAEGVDLFVYAPFDWFWPVWRFLKRLRPSVLIVAKYDTWPNLLWCAKQLGIPRFLVNATLYDSSSRLHFPLRQLLKPIYRSFNAIFAISENDRQNLLSLTDQSTVTVVGDTKYDQVLYRAEESRKLKLIPETIFQNRPVWVCGSTWSEDEAHVLPAAKALLQQFPQLLIVICPHEPTSSHLTQLESQLAAEKHLRLSSLNSAQTDIQFLLIDRIGVLANLYSIASVAYVGGSFKQNIHNVLEPAVYGIPVLFGPVNQNSHEAQLLKESGGAFEVQNTADILETLRHLLNQPEFLQRAGSNARNVVLTHAGATQKMLNAIFASLQKK
jgi:3-deoxy-D-manno-octulosonic-acid transferase